MAAVVGSAFALSACNSGSGDVSDLRTEVAQLTTVVTAKEADVDRVVGIPLHCRTTDETQREFVGEVCRAEVFRFVAYQEITVRRADGTTYTTRVSPPVESLALGDAWPP